MFAAAAIPAVGQVQNILPPQAGHLLAKIAMMHIIVRNVITAKVIVVQTIVLVIIIITTDPAQTVFVQDQHLTIVPMAVMKMGVYD